MPSPLICWDSCVFLAWFQNEADKPLGAIEQTLRSVDARRTNLLVSTLSYAEVLDKAGVPSSPAQLFRAYVKRANVFVADVDIRVATLAADFRMVALEALRKGDISQGIKIPDALIAATAVVYRADELQTFDPVLLETSGWPVLNGLRIVRPGESSSTAGDSAQRMAF